MLRLTDSQALRRNAKQLRINELVVRHHQMEDGAFFVILNVLVMTMMSNEAVDDGMTSLSEGSSRHGWR